MNSATGSSSALRSVSGIGRLRRSCAATATAPQPTVARAGTRAPGPSPRGRPSGARAVTARRASGVAPAARGPGARSDRLGVAAPAAPRRPHRPGPGPRPRSPDGSSAGCSAAASAPPRPPTLDPSAAPTSPSVPATWTVRRERRPPEVRSGPIASASRTSVVRGPSGPSHCSVDSRPCTSTGSPLRSDDATLSAVCRHTLTVNHSVRPSVQVLCARSKYRRVLAIRKLVNGVTPVPV